MAILKPQTPLTPEQQLQRRRNLGVGLAALSETLRGGDPVARTLGLMEQFEQEEAEKQAKQKETEMQELREKFFADPKYRNLAKILGDEFAFGQMQSDLQAETQAQANQNLNVAIDKSDLPQSQKDLLKSLSPNLKAQALMKSFEPKKITPSDYKAEILGKIQRGEALTPEDQRVLDILQRTDPIDIAIRQYAGQPITETPTNTQEKEIKTYASKEEAINAGLKSGDQFYGTDGALYQIP